MLQLLGIRAFFDNKLKRERKYHTFFERNWTLPSLEDALKDPVGAMDGLNVPLEDRWNLYFTVADCYCEKERDFERLRYLPIDVDNIDKELTTETVDVVCKAINIEFDKTGIVFTGNGLQFFPLLNEPLRSTKDFDTLKPYYMAMIHKINDALRKAHLPGMCDPSVFEPTRLMRMPGTENRKDKGISEAYVVQSKILPQNFDIKRAAGIPDIEGHQALDAETFNRFITVDTDNVQSGCSFIAHAKKNPADLREPEWYSLLSIVGRLENGVQLAHDYSKGHPKYNPYETDQKLQQALLASGPRTCNGISEFWEGCKTCPHFGKVKSPILIQGEDFIRTKDTGFYNIEVIEGAPPKRSPAFDDVVKFIKKTHFYYGDHKAFYAFDKTHWRRINDEIMAKTIHDIFVPKITKSSMFNEVFSYAKKELTKTGVEASRIIEPAQGYINFANGVFEVETKTLLPHRKEHGFSWVLPYAYDPEASAPRFELFMDEITCGKQEFRDLLLTYMALTICNVPNNEIQKMLMLVGGGANGKSVFLEVYRFLVGLENCSGVPLGQLIETKVFDTVGKLANVIEEPSFLGSMRDPEALKTLVGGGRLQARALYGQSFNVSINAKMAAACNELPATFDNSNGFYRRLIIVPFDAEFNGEKRDTKLLERLIGELPGIFNMILPFYEQFRKHGWLYEEFGKEHVEAYAHENDTVRQFIDECVVIADNPDSGLKVSGNELYERFKAFHHEMTNSHTKLSKTRFCKRVRKIMAKNEFFEHRKIWSKDKKSLSGYVGIGLQSDF